MIFLTPSYDKIAIYFIARQVSFYTDDKKIVHPIEQRESVMLGARQLMEPVEPQTRIMVKKGGLSKFMTKEQKENAAKYSSLQKKDRHNILRRAIKKRGTRSVIAMLNALVVYRKNATEAEHVRQRQIFQEDLAWIRREYGG